MASTATAARASGRSLGAAFDPRHNSLNFLRLVFALAVLLDHSSALAGFGGIRIPGKISLGTAAVYGFFAISGFLIAGSALDSRPANYLKRRFLRIVPGFWTALIVTAFVISGALFLLRPPPAAGCAGVPCYLGAPDGPFSYVFGNAALWITQPGIAGTPWNVAAPGIWNGSLWTIAYEFAGYLILLALAIAGLLARRGWIFGLAAASWLAVIVATAVPWLNDAVSSAPGHILLNAMKFAPVLLTGSFLWVWRDRIPDSGWLAAGCFGLALGSLWLPIGADVPMLSLTTGAVAGPLLVYPVLWLGSHLPLTRVGRRHDYSYGVYLYAWPVQVALLALGAAALGLAGFTLLTIVVVAVFAIASWHLVEHPAIRLGHRRRATSIALPASPAA